MTLIWIDSFLIQLLFTLLLLYHNSPTLGKQELTEDAIRRMLAEAGISKPEWKNIAKKIGFQLQGPNSSGAFFKQWCEFADRCVPSWENLASALDKAKIKEVQVKKIREKAGMMMLQLCYTCQNPCVLKFYLCL